MALRRSCVRQLASAWFAVCALLALGVGEQSAEASCGDYLQHTTAPFPDDLGEQLPQRPVRCTSPQCGQAPLPPLVPPAPVIPDSLDQRWVTTRSDSLRLLQSPTAADAPRCADARPVAGVMGEVEHIPRGA